MSAALCHGEAAAAEQCEVKQFEERTESEGRKGQVMNGQAEIEEQSERGTRKWGESMTSVRKRG